jgi:hypothetical protein
LQHTSGKDRLTDHCSHFCKTLNLSVIIFRAEFLAMLSIQKFNRLSNPEKYAILEDNGTYLQVYRIEGPFKIALFALPWCYCEVWLNQSTNQLLKATAFKSYKKLDSYLGMIDITPVLSQN